jgi:peroxiredoxin
MILRLVHAAACSLLLLGPAFAAESPREGPRVLLASERGVGRLVPDIAFTAVDGRSGKLSDFRSGPALVIALTSTTCPVTMKYAPALARLEKEFSARGVAFLFVNPTATDTPADIHATITANALAGPYVHDRDSRLVAALDARSTAEVFILDATRTLIYRGAVDDQYGLGYALAAPRATYARDALTAVLAKCHRDGGVAPFSLATYEDVRAHAGMMRKQVARGAMPPWFAAPPAPGESSHWRNDRSLSAADKADLLAWLAGEKTLGDPADAPLPRMFPDGWLIGAPDTVLEFPRPVAIKADGVMPYQTIYVETKFPTDRWIQAYEIQPSARAVVHHVIVRVHPPGPAARREKAAAAGERDGFFAAYVPGNTHAIFPPGFAKKIPAGATLSFQMHYTPNGRATTDQTRLGLVFASSPPLHVIHVAGLSNHRLRIPPGAARHPETASITIPSTVTVLGFLPHMHVRGLAARYEAILPDGARRLLLDVPAYDFNWQLPYQLAAPLTLPRGTRLVYTAWYDNSPGNPANPDATKTVRWGPQTFDEMMLGYVEYYFPERTLPAGDSPL